MSPATSWWIAVTIFAATKAPLCTGSRPWYHLTQSKVGSIFQHRVGAPLASPRPPPGRSSHKLMHDDGARTPQSALTDASRWTTPISAASRNWWQAWPWFARQTYLAAVETLLKGSNPLAVARVKCFRLAEIVTLAKRNFNPASTVVSDGCAFSPLPAKPVLPSSRSITDLGRQAAPTGPRVQWRQHLPSGHPKAP